jgi:hypothetical protein
VVVGGAVILAGAIIAMALSTQLTAIGQRLDSLGFIDWTHDTEEHEASVYKKITELVRDPRVQHFHVMTVFKPLEDPNAISKATEAAMTAYYSALLRRLESKDLEYKRVAILRSRLGEAAEPENLLLELKLERPPFVRHFKELSRIDREVGPMRFFMDDGRLLDVAFALAMDADRRPVSLVIELAVTSTGTARLDGPDGDGGGDHPRRALALLTINHPTPRLTEVFQNVYDSVWNGKILDPISSDTVRKSLN